MDFIDQIRQFATQVKSLAPAVQTEEATKHSLILPFIQLLGYNVFDPHQVIPEFTADVGTKKGEKVDYCIQVDGKPSILLEAKKCGDPLTEHDSQLFRYFSSVVDARFAILTNGITYKFYSDIDEKNLMDLQPFMELNLFDIREPIIAEVKRFRREAFNPNDLFTAAEELKYLNAIKARLSEELREPSEDLVRFLIKDVYSGKKVTAGVQERFRPIVKRAASQYINDILTDRLKSVMDSTESQEKTTPDITPTEETEPEVDISKPKIFTTQEELETYYAIKAMLMGVVEPSRISYKDTQSYFAVLLDGKVTKWICRLYMNVGKAQKSICFPGEEKPIFMQLEQVDDILQYKEQMIQVVQDLVAS